MIGWSEKCKEEIMKDIPSCHDDGIICGTSTNAFNPPMKIDKCK